MRPEVIGPREARWTIRTLRYGLPVVIVPPAATQRASFARNLVAAQRSAESGARR